MNLPTRQAVWQYIVLGVINTLVVYLVYTPYIVLWVGLDWTQYVRWLQGGILYSLLTGWIFALVIVRVKSRLFDRRQDD